MDALNWFSRSVPVHVLWEVEPQGVVLLCGAGVMMGSYSYFISSCRGVAVPTQETTDGGVACTKEEKDLLERNKQRQEQEKLEKGEALSCVRRHVGMATVLHQCSDMGSRLQKNWFSVPTIVTAAPLSKSCRLTLDKKTLKLLNKILHHLEHPHLLPVLSVEYSQMSGHVMVMQFQQGGSLRDLIYQQGEATLDWAEKYPAGGKGSRPLLKNTVATYGRQILEAVVYLYEQGFPSLGHIQTGNIFVNISREGVARAQPSAGEGAGLDEVGQSVGKGAGEGVGFGAEEEAGLTYERCIVDNNCYCRLGGYENTLLGYRPRLHRGVVDAGKLGKIDTIMFGHVIYEMTCGREIEGVEPTEGDYAAVYDGDIRTVLRDIFSMDADDRRAIPQILSWPLFNTAETHSCLKGAENLPDNLKTFLTKYFGHKGTNRCALS